MMLQKKIRNKLGLYKNMLKNVPTYLKNTSPSPKVEDDVPYAVCNLDRKLMNQSQGRFSFILSKYFELAGFKLFIKTDLYYYSEINRYKKLLLQKTYSFIRNSRIPANSILIRQGRKQKFIRVQYGIGIQEKGSFDCIAPFPMHPSQVDNYNQAVIDRYRVEPRNVKVFFSGNVDKSRYSERRLLDKYKVITRYELFVFLKEKYEQRGVLEIIDERDDLYKILAPGTAAKEIVFSQAKSDAGDWLTFLSKSDFFFAPPGVAYPWCHNSIEAMAVGTIPILQYSNLFFPHLEHMKNCLCYDNYEDLEAVLEMVINMSPEEIQRLRNNVIDYFDTYLSPEMMVNKIKAFMRSDKEELHVAIPFINSLK